MDRAGSADPPVVFSSSELLGRKKVYKTKVSKNTLNPTWHRDELPEMPKRWQKKESVLSSHITCQVFDRDFGTDDDLIGTVLIDFENAETTEGKEFNLPIVKYGVKRGILKGRVYMVPAEGTITSL